MTAVLLLNSPLFRDHNPLYDEDSLPPIGLGYIATLLAEADITVELVDAVASRLPLHKLLERIDESRPDVVATNIFSTNYELVKELVESISGYLPRVIIGGLATRTLYEMIFQWNYHGPLDVVFGDGELITPDLVRGTVVQLPTDTRGQMRFFRVDARSPYFCTDISNIPLDRSFFTNEPVAHPRGFLEANIVTSRGCIYNCSFCAAARSLNADLAVRERSEASLGMELDGIGRLYPSVTSIRVLDDLFLKGPECIAKAISVFGRRQFTWRSMAHVNTFSQVEDATLASLRDSGCAELFIGVESGSPKVLRSIHKTQDLARIHDNLSRVLHAGIAVKAYFIFGFPDETREDFELSYQLAADLKAESMHAGTSFRTSVFQYRPYHGTAIYQELRARGVDDQRVVHVEGNAQLSSLVGRLQFNFQSGNYSAESIEVVQDYIHRTANLTNIEA